MAPSNPRFLPPNLIARAVNRLYGRLTAIGVTPSYSYLLQSKGRKTGKIRSTPVNVLRHDMKLYLVGTRGQTQWSRNVLIDAKITLTRGKRRERFRLRVVPDENKGEILKAYLTRFNWMAWRFFPISPTAPVSAFAAIAERYPVFELVLESTTGNGKYSRAC